MYPLLGISYSEVGDFNLIRSSLTKMIILQVKEKIIFNKIQILGGIHLVL